MCRRISALKHLHCARQRGSESKSNIIASRGDPIYGLLPIGSLFLSLRLLIPHNGRPGHHQRCDGPGFGAIS